MAERARKSLRAQPSRVDFGRTATKSTLAGSFQIIGAGSCADLACHWEESGRPLCLDSSVPNWLHLDGPIRTGYGLEWSFRLDSNAPGFKEASLSFACDAGTAHVTLSADVRAGEPALGDLAFCDEPFDSTTEDASVFNLVRLLEGLDFRVHHLGSAGGLGTGAVPSAPRTLLLHGSGLLDAAAHHLDVVRALPEAGTNLVVLADKFFQRTAEAADAVLRPWGFSFLKGSERGARTAEALLRRDLKVCGPSETRPHPLTTGVRRTRWFRAWPIDCRASEGRAVPLITHPAHPGRCIVAAAKPNGYVVAVGTSLWGSLAGVGWPYANDRLLANLLAGGNAERAVSTKRTRG